MYSEKNYIHLKLRSYFFLNLLICFYYSIGRYYVVDESPVVWVYLSDRSFKVSWRGWGIQVATSSYWGASGLSSRTTSLLCLHGITTFCHSETWLFISLLCWWHSTLPLIPSWWSDDSCLHLSMSNRHFLLDEGHHLQLNLAKTELLVISANPSLHHNFTFQ